MDFFLTITSPPQPPQQQVQWVNKGVERGETLVSISTDGRVVEWSMKKGLSFSPLMVLKRIGERQVAGQSERRIHRDVPCTGAASSRYHCKLGLHVLHDQPNVVNLCILHDLSRTHKRATNKSRPIGVATYVHVRSACAHRVTWPHPFNCCRQHGGRDFSASQWVVVRLLSRRWRHVLRRHRGRTDP